MQEKKPGEAGQQKQMQAAQPKEKPELPTGSVIHTGDADLGILAEDPKILPNRRPNKDHLGGWEMS